MEPITIIVGFDQRESIAYHVFCQSVLEKTTTPVKFLPLSTQSLRGYQECHNDGSNAFTYSRFLSPYLMNYEGWALFADGDMICNDDITKLWSLRNPAKAAQVVKHNYVTKAAQKYLGNKNQDYPRKNWSSVIIWNCGHQSNKVLTPEFISVQTGAFLHRFQWLKDEEIGEIPKEWNWLATEYESNPDAKLIHYTLGTPCFSEYKTSAMSGEWHRAFKRAIQGYEN